MNKKIDLVVSFDTTGSMYPCLAQVRREVEKFVHTMFDDFVDLRISIIAHGDYCDKDNPYTIRVMDFTRDELTLSDFIKETKSTYGGDFDECYELVLHTAHADLHWRDDAERVMLLIGDATPHGVGYRDNKDNLDWRIECDKLHDIGVRVFAVHALSNYRVVSKNFYTEVANRTHGMYLTLDQFDEVVDLIKATCYQQYGEEKLNEFVTIIKDSGRLTRTMSNNIRRLKGETVEDVYVHIPKSRGTSATVSADVKLKDLDDLIPVMPGRFQKMIVDKDTAIKEFVEFNGITFKKGRGFYELSKAETVQQYKEVIMQDRETGEMFTGAQVRKRLGLQPQSEKGGVKERLHKADAEKFRVFVQSTSVNRKLIKGTTFLYEVSDIDDVPVASTVMEEESKEVKGKVKKSEADSKPVETKVEEVKVEVKEESKVEEVKTEPKGGLKLIHDEVKMPDTSAIKKFEKKSKKEKAKKPVKVKTSSVDSKIEKVKSSVSKVTEGLERYRGSSNKKNTAFLSNNLKKLIKEAQSLLDIVDAE